MNREWWENTQNKTNIWHKLKRTTHSFFIFQWKRDMIPLREENEETEERRERCTNWQGGKKKNIHDEIAHEYRGHDTHRHTHSEREKERKRWEMRMITTKFVPCQERRKRTITTSTRWERREKKNHCLESAVTFPGAGHTRASWPASSDPSWSYQCHASRPPGTQSEPNPWKKKSQMEGQGELRKCKQARGSNWALNTNLRSKVPSSLPSQCPTRCGRVRIDAIRSAGTGVRWGRRTRRRRATVVPHEADTGSMLPCLFLFVQLELVVFLGEDPSRWWLNSESQPLWRVW